MGARDDSKDNVYITNPFKETKDRHYCKAIKKMCSDIPSPELCQMCIAGNITKALEKLRDRISLIEIRLSDIVEIKDELKKKNGEEYGYKLKEVNYGSNIAQVKRI